MRKLPPIKQVIAEKTVCVLLVRGESPQGAKIYAYIAIRADRLEEFMEAQARGIFYPEEYGIVIESGEGEPNPEVRERMTREYGFNHEGMIDIDNSDKAYNLANNIGAIASGRPSE